MPLCLRISTHYQIMHFAHASLVKLIRGLLVAMQAPGLHEKLLSVLGGTDLVRFGPEQKKGTPHVSAIMGAQKQRRKDRRGLGRRTTS